MTISISHGGQYQLSAAPDQPIFEDQLYIFTFSQEEGMRIYINGLEEAHDPDFTLPVEQFLVTSIGVSEINGFGSGVSFATIQMLECQFYDYVPSIAQIRALEKGLLEYYRL